MKHKTKVILVCVLMAVILPLVGGSALQYALRKYTVAQVKRTHAFFLSMVVQQLDTFITRTQEEFLALVDSLPLDRRHYDLSLLGPHLNKALKTDVHFENGFFALDQEGNLVSSAPPRPGLLGRNFAFRPYFQRARKEKRPLIYGPYVSARTGKPVLSFVKPVLDSRGRFRGLIAASLLLNGPYALGGLRAMHFGQAGFVTVTTPQGKVVVSSRPPGLDPSPAEMVVTSSGPLPITGWRVNLYEPKSQAFALIYALGRWINLVRVGALLFGLLVGVIVGIYLTRPLDLLRRRVEAVRTDDPRFDSQGLMREDEVGALAGAFDEMTRGLAAALQREREFKTQAESSRKFAEGLLASARDAILVSDELGRIHEINPAFEEMFGVLASQVVGRDASFMAEDQQSFKRDYRRVMDRARQEGIWTGLLRMKDSQGRRFIVEATVSPVPGQEEREGLFISVMRDATQRLEAEKALRESEERYRVLTERSLTGIYIIQDGRFVFVNPRMCEMLACEPQDLLGREPWDFVHPEDREMVRNRGLPRSQGRPVDPDHYEFRFLLADGRVSWVEVRATIISLGGKPAALGNIVDITERRQALAELERRAGEVAALSRVSGAANLASDQESLLREVMEIAKMSLGAKAVAVFFWENGRSRLAAQSGFSQGVVCALEHLPPDHPLIAYPRQQEQARYWSASRLRHLALSASQVLVRVPVVSRQEPLGYMLLLLSETPDAQSLRLLSSVGLELGTAVERLRLVEALHQSEERLRDLLENAGDLIMSVDPDGNLLFVNRCFKQTLGYGDEEVQDLNLALVMDPEPRRRLLQTFRELASGDPVREVETVFHTRSGEMVLLEGSISGRLEAGRLASVRCILRDVTSRRQMEEALQRAQRIEALGIMAGGMAHDFNNVLQSIGGEISLMLERLEPQDPMYAQLQKMAIQIDVGKSVTRQLLNVSRADPPGSQVIDLNRLVREAAEVVGRTHKGVKLEYALSEKLPALRGDYYQLHQAVVNVVINACQACGEGGLVCIRTGLADISADQAQAQDIMPGKFLWLEVADNGVGMDPDTLARIFDPFFTTKDRHRGTGLGLTMVYNTLRIHQGTVAVDSKLHQGTRVTLYLPALSGPALPLRQQEEVPSRPLSGRGETILVVDDETPVRQVLMEMLEELGYQTLSADNGRRALDLYRHQGESIDLVILDMVMPDMDGHQVYLALKKLDPRVKVLLSTGHSLHGKLTDIIGDNRDRYLGKPYGLAELSFKVRKILEQS